MYFKRIILFLFLCLTLSINIFPESRKQNLVILPFVELKGSENINHYETLISSYLYLHFDNTKDYNVFYPLDRRHINKSLNNFIEDYYDPDTFVTLMKNNKADFLIGGEYVIKKNKLFIKSNIYNKTSILNTSKYYEIPIKKVQTKFNCDEEEISEYNNINIVIYDVTKEIVKTFSKSYTSNSGYLEIITNDICMLYLNDISVAFGKTPGKFRLPIGTYNIKLVYPDKHLKEKTIFKKNIELKKDNVCILNDVKVFSALHIKSNVEAYVYIDDKMIGLTNADLLLPAGNEYNLNLMYIDEMGRKIYKKDKINTDAEKIYKEYIFYGSIEIKGNSLMSGTINKNQENKELPYVFDYLEPGDYHIKVFLNDFGRNKQFIIFNKTLFLKNAQSTIIDMTDINYQKKIGLCFIPGAAQFYNFQSKKGMIFISLAGISLVGSIVTGYLAIDHYYNTLLESQYKDNIQLSRNQTIFNVLTISSVIIFGVTYTYSFFDGKITMNHLYNLFY